MKLRRLPEIDLALVAIIERVLKAQRLRSFNSGGGSWSYGPARQQVAEVFQCDNPLGLSVGSTSLSRILDLVRKACTRGEVQESSNIEVTQLLHDWVDANVEQAVLKNIPPVALGPLGAVDYCSNLIASIGGQPTILFFDHRRDNGLTAASRKFVFSMMHEQARVPFPELASARLCIVQFRKIGKTRTVARYDHNEGELYSFDELSAMIEETYLIWEEVLKERRDAGNRPMDGGLFGTG